MKKKLFTFYLFFVVFMSMTLISLASPTVENSDRPSKGTWNFNLQKVWCIDSAGKTPIAGPAGMVITKDENVVLLDQKRGCIFILDKDGKFIKSFGRKGEGPGHIKSINTGARLFILNDTIAIFDFSTLHFFSHTGNYIRTVRTRGGATERSICFSGKDSFISVQNHLPRKPAKTVNIYRIDVKSGKKTVLFEAPFTRPAPKTIEGRRMVIKGMPGLTPGIIMGLYNNRIYYGVNNTYRILSLTWQASH